MTFSTLLVCHANAVRNVCLHEFESKCIFSTALNVQAISTEIFNIKHKRENNHVGFVQILICAIEVFQLPSLHVKRSI